MTGRREGRRVSTQADPGLQSGLSGARVLVTGASGFIGRCLARRLSVEGATVVAWDRVEHRPNEGSVLPRVVDLSDPTVVEGGFDTDGPFDATVHLASRGAGIRTLVEAVEDARLTSVLLEKGAAQGATGHFVFFGSADQYGAAPAPQSATATTAPINAYGLAKNLADAIIRHAKVQQLIRVPVSTVRPFSVYGPGQPARMFLSQLAEAVRTGTAFRMSAGTQVRDFVHVEDVCEAVVRLLCTPSAHGGTFVVGTGRGIGVAEAAKVLCAAVSADIPIIRDDSTRPDDPPALVADASETRERLGWEPAIDLVTGFRGLLAAGGATDG